MGRGYVRFQKPFSSLKQPKPRAECPSVIKVALNEAWHIQRDGGGAGGAALNELGRGRAVAAGSRSGAGDGTEPRPPAPGRRRAASPRLRAAGERKGRKKKKSFCVSRRAWGEGNNKKKKKKTTRGWSARETFDFVFLAIFFLGRKGSWGCRAEATGRSQEHPRPTQGPKFSAQRPPGPSAAEARFKARSSQEKLKSETVRDGGRAAAGRGHRRGAAGWGEPAGGRGRHLGTGTRRLSWVLWRTTGRFPRLGVGTGFCYD